MPQQVWLACVLLMSDAGHGDAAVCHYCNNIFWSCKMAAVLARPQVFPCGIVKQKESLNTNKSTILKVRKAMQSSWICRLALEIKVTELDLLCWKYLAA